MKVVAISKNTQKHFESQDFQNEEEKSAIETCLRKDAQLAGIDIDIAYMTDTEFEQLVAD